MWKSVFICVLFCFIFTLHASTDYDYSDNTLIVVIKPEFSHPTKSVDNAFFGDLDENATIENISLIHNAKAIEAINKRGSQYQAIYKITLPTHDKALIHQTIATLNKNPHIAYATPNYKFPPDLVPNDPEYEFQWALNGTHGIQVEQAWDITTGSHARVGVIDTGIAPHPDLEANILPGWDFEHNGSFTDDDTFGHGTHVAGTIGAIGNNELGVVGVNWNVPIIPLQTGDFFMDMDALVSAITYAANTWGTDEQISLLNHSISGYGWSLEDPRLPAINNYPGLFVWSAGNGNPETNGYDVDTNVDPPQVSYYDLENIIAVGAIQYDGQKADFSAYSSSGQYVHVYAPGVNIASTVPGGGYELNSGTSMAAPHVSGVAAMLLSVNPALTASEIKQILINTADPLTITIPEGEQTVNRLNAANAVQLAGIYHLTVSPTTYNFGYVELGETTHTQTFTLSIRGDATDTINSITLAGANTSNFTLNATGLPWTLHTGDSQTFTVSFTPESTGAKTAHLIIASDAYEHPLLVYLSGRGWLYSVDIPYSQDFDQITALNDICWVENLRSNMSGLRAGFGVDGTNGFVLHILGGLYQDVYTPTFMGITPQTTFSFAYRNMDFAYSEAVYPYQLEPEDKVYIEASTTGISGPYELLYEINSTNHDPTVDFGIIDISLYEYSGENVNIRIAAERITDWEVDYGMWYFIFDDVTINFLPRPENITATKDRNNVTISWTPPPEPINLIGYTLYRNTTPLIETPALVLSFTDENLLQGTYTYHVRAVYSEGASNPSTIKVEVPKIYTPPYAQNFYPDVSLPAINWGGVLNAQSGIYGGSGVDRTAGLVLNVRDDSPVGEVISPALNDVTEAMALSFAYRIVGLNSIWTQPLTPITLSTGDAVYVEVSTTGDTGVFTEVFEINSANHQPSTAFTVVEIPLSVYNGQCVNIRFRAVCGSGNWNLVIDNVVVGVLSELQPPQNLVGTTGNGFVSLEWQAPESVTPQGYKVYRSNRLAISDVLDALTYLDTNIINGLTYSYYVTAVYSEDAEIPSNAVTVRPNSEFDEVGVPLVTALHGNYPNPFNPETVISFSLGVAGFVSIDIYNVRGQKVRSLVSGVFGTGVHSVVWNGLDETGRSVGSGVYFYRMVSGDYSGVKKMLLLK